MADRRDKKCNGAHTWKSRTTWHDTANALWTEEECQLCGLLRRSKSDAKLKAS